ncbi:hypothetical protein Q5P01_005252 [Channa striata]|uniref:Serpin domain-containing protein n=1 Tax=Channa striata TaxID=64152 RepID=A0AA88NDG4_CHASR|nr:hypothetical protein Q5P01_005252 [Channa striata]
MTQYSELGYWSSEAAAKRTRTAVKMMPGTFAICALTSVLLSVTWAEDLRPHHHPHHQHHPDHHEEQLIWDKLHYPNANFAIALYKRLNAEAAAGKNIFFSPLGISNALSVLSAGASGETHRQLFSTLGYSTLNQTQVNKAYEHFLHTLGHGHENEQVNVGNAVALRSGFKPERQYLSVVRHYFLSDIFEVDLSKLDEAAAEINKFIANKTQNKIEDAVKDLDSDMRMMLINYVYFKGEWGTPFSPRMTHKADFHVNATTTVQVDMMTNEDVYDIYRDTENHTTVVQLPYKGNTFMMIVLPDEDKMEEVEGYISRDYVRHWHKSVKGSCVNLSLPKFSISADYSLDNTLKEMGIIDAFEDRADFSGLSEAEDLKVTTVSHQAVLNVDESGTEAAAATTVQISVKSACFSEPIKVTRPFFAFIVEKPTRTLLFMAKINNPTAA